MVLGHDVYRTSCATSTCFSPSEPSDLEEVGALRPEILPLFVTTSGVTTTTLLTAASLMLSGLAESLPTLPAVGCR